MSFEEDREMHTATCGDCGNECQVPFKPKEDRPVYCRECFKDVVETDLEEDLDSIDKERCTPQHVVIAEMNVKYHSNLKKTDLFIVENASPSV